MVQPRQILVYTALILSFGMVVPAVADADVDHGEASTVCRHWLDTIVAMHGDWGGSTTPEVSDVQPLVHEGSQVGWLCTVTPSGYVVVPLRHELAPVKAYSEFGSPAPAAAAGLFILTLDDLAERSMRLADSLGHQGPEHLAWQSFRQEGTRDKDAQDEAGPLLHTRWSQDWPYNTDCPQGDGRRTYVGCTALATAQLMRHHAWPPRGIGNVSYWWAGDDGCGGGTPGDTLRADLSDTYDWAAMTDEVVYGDPQESLEAVAELCYETAAACLMDFSACGSATSVARARAALLNRFRYLPTARELQRFRMTDDDWFDVIRDNVDQGLPMLYASTIHTMVCDGWSEVEDLRLVHINYGWAGDSDGWFALDAVETSLNPAAERLLCDIEPDLSTPIVLDAFVAERTQDGAMLTWSVGMGVSIDGLHVWRGNPGGESVRMTATPLALSARMDWLDREAPPTATVYWLEEMVDGTGKDWHGPALLPASSEDEKCRLSSPCPNPCNPLTTIALTLDRPQRVRVAVHDGRGRVVAILAEGNLPAGRTALRWDGRTSDGRPAPSGIYLIGASGDGFNKTEKVLLNR